MMRCISTACTRPLFVKVEENTIPIPLLREWDFVSATDVLSGILQPLPNISKWLMEFCPNRWKFDRGPYQLYELENEKYIRTTVFHICTFTFDDNFAAVAFTLTWL